MKKLNIVHLLRFKQTVFSFKEIFLASGESNPILLRRRLNYYVKRGLLYNMRRGLYAKDDAYDKRELATKIFIPSYISFETVLAEAGVIFQYYSSIFVATYQTKIIDCDKQTFSFRKIKDEILMNNEGIENKGNYCIATKERAFLDLVYLNNHYHFDNLSPLDWNKISTLLPIYNNTEMNIRVQKYFNAFKLEGRK